MSINLARQALFLQVYDSLAQRIASGVWMPGPPIPNETDLAREFGVSVGTMRKALDLLEERRLIERRQGRGTFVLDHATDELTFRYVNVFDANDERIVSTQTTVLSQGIGEATQAECDQLDTVKGEKILRTRRVRDHHRRPISYEEASIAVGRLSGFKRQPRSPSDYLIVPFAQQHGIRLGRATEKITHLPASSEIARLLQLKRGTELLKLDRVVYSIGGEAIEWRIAFCNLVGGYYVAVMK
jgi:GntR family transcriptional regulator